MSGHLLKRQITLAPGVTTILHLMPVADPNIIMVEPAPPLAAWDNITHGQPTKTSVAFNNAGSEVVVNVEFSVPSEAMGVARADDY